MTCNATSTAHKESPSKLYGWKSTSLFTLLKGRVNNKEDPKKHQRIKRNRCSPTIQSVLSRCHYSNRVWVLSFLRSRSPQVSIPSCSKGRSYSTTSIPSNALGRRNSRERKTVCSLHPLTNAEIEAFHEAHAQQEDDLQIFQRRIAAQRETDAETTEDDEEGGQPLPPLPCIRRALKGEGIISSDYESSNESPVSSENNDLLSVDDHLSKSLAVQTVNQDLSRCTLCGGRPSMGSPWKGLQGVPIWKMLHQQYKTLVSIQH
ncbi:uncharacterized protein CDAR_256401 [Caerostris darwini]|uniref:Uncharacterized protein n=1 Tax=Caerostris darwini TaxID=1538125 RepID=A0AAV4SCT7_9ARAC|nr:uncharacterized protein CDAR_256401 [Caerostris darwini]